LAELHQLDLIHGDIKSNNIAYFENGSLKLVD
jgi:serine/threonine protein kinase